MVRCSWLLDWRNDCKLDIWWGLRTKERRWKAANTWRRIDRWKGKRNGLIDRSINNIINMSIYKKTVGMARSQCHYAQKDHARFWCFYATCTNAPASTWLDVWAGVLIFSSECLTNARAYRFKSWIFTQITHSIVIYLELNFVKKLLTYCVTTTTEPLIQKWQFQVCCRLKGTYWNTELLETVCRRSSLVGFGETTMGGRKPPHPNVSLNCMNAGDTARTRGKGHAHWTVTHQSTVAAQKKTHVNCNLHISLQNQAIITSSDTGWPLTNWFVYAL